MQMSLIFLTSAEAEKLKELRGERIAFPLKEVFGLDKLLFKITVQIVLGILY